LDASAGTAGIGFKVQTKAKSVGEHAMKKFLLGTVGLVALGMAAPAMAADLPVQTYSKVAPVMIPVAYDWSGFYLGVNGGWGSTRTCWDEDLPGGSIASAGCHDATGGVAGGQIGYRWEASYWVFGLEAQGNWANLRGSNTSLVSGAPFSNRSRIDAFGLFTGQIGYAFNSALLYVKGGAAVVADRYDGFNTSTGTVFDTAPGENRWGGTVGAGIEFSFAPNWSAAVEYDHIFLGTNQMDFASSVDGTFTRQDRVRQDADLVTVRVNYRWGGPIIGKY
jgi:outer membrane immunogenic protein